MVAVVPPPVAVDRTDPSKGVQCNAVLPSDGQPAVVQWEVPCNQCGDVAAAMLEPVADLQVQADVLQQQLDATVGDLEAVADPLANVDQVVQLSAVRNDVEAVLTPTLDEIQQRQRFAATHDAPHTHPVFACAAHEGLNPALSTPVGP